MAWTNEAPSIDFNNWFWDIYVPLIEERFPDSEAARIKQASIEWAPLYDDAWTDLMLWQALQDILILQELSENTAEIEAIFQQSLAEAEEQPTPEDIIVDIEEAIDEGIDELDVLIDETRDTIINTIIFGSDTNRGVLENVIRSVSTEIMAGQGGLGDLISGVFDGISGGLAESTGLLGDVLDVLQGGVKVVIENKINIPADVFDVVVGGIGDILDGEHDFIDGVLATTLEALRQIFLDKIEEEAPILIDIGVAIREQTAAETTADEAMIEEVAKISDPTIEGTGAKVLESVLAAAVKMGRDGEQPSWEELYSGFDPQLYRECDPIDADDNDKPGWFEFGTLSVEQKAKLAFFFSEKFRTVGNTDTITNQILYLLGKAMGVLTIATANSQRELYEFSRCVPWEIFQVGDTLQAFQRNLISRNQAINEIKMRGYNEARAETLIQTGYIVPDAASLYSMNLRELAPGANLVDRFQDAGFSPEDAEALDALKYYIPPPQDLITMSVRDVFSPEIVRKYRQDEDFPDDFAKWSKQQGISEFWARKYWQAHWVLPSVQMGYEMLHRRVITEAELKDLMRAQDIMPGWRDALVEISYRPYTRVDIRRMHRVGVLSDQQVYEAYRDIGYNDAKAKTLRDFTIELNRDDDAIQEDLEGITRSSVMAAFKDGIITRDTADDLLKEAGIGTQARLIYLTDASLDRERRLRNDSVDLILTEYERGVTSESEAVFQITMLTLTTLEDKEARLKLRK
ncbi:MAG: hypothetical protein P8K83_01215, partial [Woeseiaceae bacterium]|nr:hypothetical protein [Woeseiaceae bacterium]